MNGNLEIIAETIRNYQNYKIITRKLNFYEQIIYYECLNYRIGYCLLFILGFDVSNMKKFRYQAVERRYFAINERVYVHYIIQKNLMGAMGK